MTYRHLVGLGLLAAALVWTGIPVAAQPGRCKAPKQWYEGKCRYADEIEKLKAESSTAEPTPTSSSTSPAPQSESRPAPTATGDGEPTPAATSVPGHESEPTSGPATTAASVPEAGAPDPPLERVPGGAPTVGRPDEAPARDEPPGGLGWQQLAALVLGGVGVASAIVGTGFAISADSTYSDSEPLCPDNLCSQEGLDIREDAFTQATVADVTFVVAGVALAGGLVLWLTAPSAHDGAAVAGTAGIALGLSGSGPGLTAQGSW